MLVIFLQGLLFCLPCPCFSFSYVLMVLYFIFLCFYLYAADFFNMTFLLEDNKVCLHLDLD